MDKISLIDGRFSLGQQKPGVELAFYELHRRGLLKDLALPYEMVLTLDSGHWSNVKWESESKWLESLSHIVSANYGLGRKTITIGGDHSIGLSTVSGVMRRNKDIALVWVDAHADFNTVQTSITGNLHGMPLNGLVNGWNSIGHLFKWIGHGIIAAERVAIIGLRDVDPKEQELLDKSGIRYWTMKDVLEKGLDDCLHEIQTTLNKRNGLDWHVSFDLYSIDPIEFPSTGCLVPGGLTFDEACRTMRFFNKGKLKSFDIVEWNPIIASTSDCDKKLIQLINEGL